MTGNARTGLGLARAEVGRAAEAVELIRAGIAACDQTGTHLTDVYQYTVLAEAQALNGAIDDALASAGKGCADQSTGGNGPVRSVQGPR